VVAAAVVAALNAKPMVAVAVVVVEVVVVLNARLTEVEPLPRTLSHCCCLRLPLLLSMCTLPTS